MSLNYLEEQKEVLKLRIKNAIENFALTCQGREVGISVEPTYKRGIKSSELLSVKVDVNIRLND